MSTAKKAVKKQVVKKNTDDADAAAEIAARERRHGVD